MKHVRDRVNNNTESGARIYICGGAGPRGDAYARDSTINVNTVREYHRPLVQALAEAGVDFIGAYTSTSSVEAAGVALEAAQIGIPCMISCTIELDQRLPSEEALGDPINSMNSVTESSRPLYYILNCVHSIHLRPILGDAKRSHQPWLMTTVLNYEM